MMKTATDQTFRPLTFNFKLLVLSSGQVSGNLRWLLKIAHNEIDDKNNDLKSTYQKLRFPSLQTVKIVKLPEGKSHSILSSS